jgi:hypothetical protein
MVGLGDLAHGESLSAPGSLAAGGKNPRQIQLPEQQRRLRDFAIDLRAQPGQPAKLTRFAREVVAAVSIGNQSANATGPVFVNGSRAACRNVIWRMGNDQRQDCRHFGSNCAAAEFSRQ